MRSVDINTKFKENGVPKNVIIREFAKDIFNLNFAIF